MPILCKRCQGNVVEAKGEYCGECKADLASAVSVPRTDVAQVFVPRTDVAQVCVPSNSMDLVEVVALSNHLGGSTLDPLALVHKFGRITSENHFGAHVVGGLVKFVDDTYWPRILLKKQLPYYVRELGMELEAKKDVKWLGAFQAPEKLSREN